MTRWSLRGRVTVAFAAASILTIFALLAGIASFRNLLDAREDVTDRYDPATVAQRDLLASLVDQESALRGYILTANDSFLTAYHAGIETETETLDALSEQLEGTGVPFSHLGIIEQLAQQWRAEYAEREIARVTAFGPGESVEEDLLAARDLFDAIRDEVLLLQQDIAASRDHGLDDLSRATWVLVVALALIAAVVFAIGVFSWVAWSRWTLRPLERLAYSTRSVAAGHLAGPLRAEGPAEISRLGGDVEAMRERIVSEFEQLEEARSELDDRNLDLARSNADLEQFAYVASHDLQEPLRKVTSFCQLLQRRYGDQLDERADQYIEFAVDGARRMQVLINDLLTFSRVGRSTAGFAPVDMQVAATRAISDLEGPVRESNARIDLAGLPTVDGDATLLTMLLRNLLGNAIKFRSEADPVVRIAAEPTVGPGGEQEWTFTVSDNGIGIDPEYAEKVFVIFQRLHTREQFEGTGIGLALAKRVVEFHDGRIWVDTARENVGTVVGFTIPRTRSTAK